jgi:hypothetical protein
MKRTSATPCVLAAVMAMTLACSTAAEAGGDRLLATWGVSQVESAGGGGLTPWALITGAGSADQIGGVAFATTWRSSGGYTLNVFGAGVGLFDTVEITAAHWRFGLSDTVPGQSLRMDVLGLKWRVFGDAVYDQDRWWPQVALGLQAKNNLDFALPQALGARQSSDVDVYASATKVWLAGLAGRNLLANLTLRATRANQFGLLGFGGDLNDKHQLFAEVSAAVLLRDDLALGAEWRNKPDNLSVFTEQAATDLFVAWFPSRHFSATLAWLDLGNIANKPNQRGWYLSAQFAL